MGTRHLIAVYCDEEYKVAQYGQYDGYPSGQGVDVLAFCQKIADIYSRNEFRERVRKCRWITREEFDKRNELIKSGEVRDWEKKWPELSRETSAKILDIISESDGLELHNSIDFAADSLFCEWAWVIDLDKNTFEGYSGFNGRELNENDRFYFLREKEKNGYHGVILVKKYSLDDLPAKPEFLKDFGDDDDA